MEWQDQGFVLATRRYGENDMIVDALTEKHGRHAGYIRGAASSKRMRGVLTHGNLVDLVWRARLDEHLGYLRPELATAYAVRLMDDALALDALNALCAVTMTLPDRAPAPEIFKLFKNLLESLSQPDLWPILLARFELALLAELGFGLDLAAARDSETAFISAQGEIIAACLSQEKAKDKRLARLPRFLIEDIEPTQEEIAEALRLTMWFFDKRVYEPRGQNVPQVRRLLVRKLNS